MNNDYTFKILIIGDSGVGKSSILTRLVDDVYINSYISTIGVDFKLKTFNLNGKKITIQIWDTAGQERFRSITVSYYKGANAIILCYDISNYESYENLTYWLNEINKYASDANLCKLILGNKSDLDYKRQVTLNEAMKFADSHNIPLIETSSKDSVNIEKAFVDIILKLITTTSPNNYPLKIISNFGKKDNYINSENKNNKSCC